VRLFKYHEIDVKVDKLFLLMMVFYGFANVLPQALIIFLVVFIHELAHTMLARGYKVNIEEIKLFPFGGVAKLDFLEGPYGFAMDIGCAHGLTDQELQEYHGELCRLLKPGAIYAIFYKTKYYNGIV